MNTNKEISRFSDFPVDDSMPLYMNHAQYHTYLCRYANHFRLREHINFGTRVHQVAPLTPQSVQGKWSIEYENKTGKTKEIFDAVIVCSGAYKKPNFPDVEGLDKFTGSVLHMHEIRSAKPFKYKKVLVLGKSRLKSYIIFGEILHYLLEIILKKPNDICICQIKSR